MELIDPLAACFLVQAVDVLCYHGAEFSLLLPACKDFMGDVRFKAKGQHFFTVKAEKILRPLLIEAVADDGFRRILEFLVVQAIHAAKIRDSRFGTDSRATEEYNPIALLNPLFQSFQLFHNPAPFSLILSAAAQKSNTHRTIGGCKILLAAQDVDVLFLVHLFRQFEACLLIQMQRMCILVVD